MHYWLGSYSQFRPWEINLCDAKRTKSSPRRLIRKIKGKTKTTAKLQEHENLLKQQTLIEPGLPLTDCASEIESLSTPDAEQVQETIDKQETHYNCSTQTEAFDYLYWSVRLLSLLGTVYTLMPMLKQRSLSAYNQLLTSKPFDQSYFREDNRNMSFCKLLEASFYHVPPFLKCSTMPHFISRDDHGSH